ncbi:IS66 family transposase [Budvicia aquatica]|uniref:IS66 family transposase n=1 Tax=Budvicia aquatica TaxID=82979 RepID=UPI0013775B2F|nr:transposase [Budvicia aquatica]
MSEHLPRVGKVISPTSDISKGLPEVGLVTQVVASKYRDYQPLYRQSHIFARDGVEIPVSTLAGGVGAAGVALAPLAELLRLDLLKRTVVHADETPLLILDAKQVRNWDYIPEVYLNPEKEAA